jgi:hypothetical protein
MIAAWLMVTAKGVPSPVLRKNSSLALGQTRASMAKLPGFARRFPGGAQALAHPPRVRQRSTEEPTAGRLLARYTRLTVSLEPS